MNRSLRSDRRPEYPIDELRVILIRLDLDYVIEDLNHPIAFVVVARPLIGGPDVLLLSLVMLR